jgi:hypothetical protein
MIDYARYISGISFRFLKPETARGQDGWYPVSKEDGTHARLLSKCSKVC